jgi:alanyl-tRNA synthetase
MELCGGTHARHTGEIGVFRIAAESAIAAGVRRIEAIAGLPAYASAHADAERLRQLAAKLGAPLGELEKKLEAMLAQQKELEKQLESLRKKQAAAAAGQLLHQAVEIAGVPTIIEAIDGAGGDELQTIADALKGLAFRGVVFLAGVQTGQVALAATVSPDFTGKFQAGKLIQAAAPMVGGKGGGRPDSARGAGKETAKIGEALGKVRALLTGE